MLARELESTEDDGKAYFDAAIEAHLDGTARCAAKDFHEHRQAGPVDRRFSRKSSLSCSRRKQERESHSSRPRSGREHVAMVITLFFVAAK